MAQLFGWSEQTWLLLDQIGILFGDIVLAISFAAAGYGWLRRDKIRRWFSGNHFPNIGGRPEGGHWQGLIFTVSQEGLPCWVIDQLRPQHVGLVVTAHSAEAGERIKSQAERDGISTYRRMIENPDDPKEVYQEVRLLLEQMRANGCSRIAVDITGGKVPMSLGAFMAAEEAGLDTLYVSTDYVNGRPDKRSAKIVAVSRNA